MTSPVTSRYTHHGATTCLCNAVATAATVSPGWWLFFLFKTRMICGSTAHDHPIPITNEHRSCALRNLKQYYSFVAVTER